MAKDKKPSASKMTEAAPTAMMAEETFALEYEAEAQATCLGSDDFRAAMIAWLKKTEAKYTGR